MLFEAKWMKITGGVINPKRMEDYPHEILEAPDIWWHGTTDKFIEEIKRNGLNPPYLTQRRDLANFSARRAAKRFGGNPIVLIISTENLDITLIGTKLDSKTESTIPPEAIIKVRQLKL